MYRFSTAAFRTLGNAAMAQNLLAIWNGSDKPLSLRKLTVQADATAALAAFAAVLRSSRLATEPTGGTALAKVPIGTMASNPGVIILGATASEGGAATAITATPTDGIWSTFNNRMHTLVGQIIPFEYCLLPPGTEEIPLVILPDSGLLVSILAAATASNPATNHYLINAMWDEQ